MFEEQIKAAKHVVAYLQKKIDTLDHSYLDRNYISIIVKLHECLPDVVPNISMIALQAIPEEAKLSVQMFFPHYVYNGVGESTIEDEWLDSHFTRNLEYMLSGLLNHNIGLQHNSAAIVTVLED
jgi:hypothetical protein